LKLVVEVLDRLGIEYMVTGAVASSLQGEPRLTHDLDFVVSVDADHVPALRSAFPPPRFYVSEEAAHEAIRTFGMFNIVETTEGDKVDFWLLTPDPFDQSRFARRYEESIFGARLKVSSPEDTILAKLRWAKLSGGSEKLYRDALRVYEVQSQTLDIGYLEQWAARLKVGELWHRLLQEAQTP
jgi:hypothetical protein